MRAFWGCWQNGTKLNFRGEFFKLTLMSPFFNPGPHDYPDIPIYISAINKNMLQLAGELCQGVHIHPLHTARYIEEGRHQVSLQCQTAESGDYDNSSVVVMNYTLQFLSLAQREQVLQAIYAGLKPGGLLFVSEKVKSSSPQFQETITHHYEAFKAHNGYAQTEIERKKEALEHVLVSLTFEQQFAMLKACGFTHVDVLIKLHNFTSFIALK